MSQLVDFYSGEGRDSEGRTWEEIMAFSFDAMEVSHDYIQWLFPLREPSDYNPDAPLLTDTDVAIFQSAPVLQFRLLESFTKFLAFIGLEWHGQYEKAANFEERKRVIFGNFNHNHLRLTRVLACLAILGQKGLAKQLLEFLVANEGCPSENTLNYWNEAVALT